jgi:hypothetical protein
MERYTRPKLWAIYRKMMGIESDLYQFKQTIAEQGEEFKHVVECMDLVAKGVAVVNDKLQTSLRYKIVRIDRTKQKKLGF